MRSHGTILPRESFRWIKPDETNSYEMFHRFHIGYSSGRCAFIMSTKTRGSVHRPKQGTVHLLARHGGKCASVELSCIIARPGAVRLHMGGSMGVEAGSRRREAGSASQPDRLVKIRGRGWVLFSARSESECRISRIRSRRRWKVLPAALCSPSRVRRPGPHRQCGSLHSARGVPFRPSQRPRQGAQGLQGAAAGRQRVRRLRRISRRLSLRANR